MIFCIIKHDLKLQPMTTSCDFLLELYADQFYGVLTDESTERWWQWWRYRQCFKKWRKKEWWWTWKRPWW
jgi:hypothetical protein